MADKLERLLTLTLVLLEAPRLLTADEIWERVEGYPDRKESFQRAFERDKDDLRDMGIPIVVADVPFTDPPQAGYRIRPQDYYLRQPDLEPDELAALHLAARTVRTDLAEGTEALWKLGGVVDPFGEPAPELASLPADPNVPVLFGAVLDRQAVSFGYRDRARAFEPWRLQFLRGRWYVTGFDREAEETRHYRVDRIDGLVRTEGERGAFERPEGEIEGVTMDAWTLGDAEPVTARLRVDAAQADWIREHLGDTADVEQQDDGSVVAEVAVRHWPAFRSLVLSFLDHAELLDPPELRADLVQWLTALAEGTGEGSAA